MRDAEQQHSVDTVSDRLDSQQFAALFEQSWRTLWTIGVAVLGRRDAVEDVLQESALIALGKLDDFDPTTSFIAWMGQIVRYTALNSGRRRQRRSAMTAGSNGVLEHTAAPESSSANRFNGTVPAKMEVDQLGFDDQLLDCMMRLSESQRTCLLLRVVNGYSYREIAGAMDMPEGTAMSHVHRAQKSLREMIGQSLLATGEKGARR